MNMVPYNNGSSWNFQNNKDPNREFLNHFASAQDKEPTMFELEEKIRLIKTLGKIERRISEIEDMSFEMLHKLRLLIIFY